MRSLKERFSNKYIINEDTGCWNWIGSCYSNGYGNIMLENKKITGAHRASWLIYKGLIPKNVNVCHKCDNVKCVNPDHLFLGTQKQNLADMTNKGRRRSNTPKGSCNINAKLNEHDVINIRKMYIPGVVTHQEIADIYNVTKRAITVILNRKGWKHV